MTSKGGEKEYENFGYTLQFFLGTVQMSPVLGTKSATDVSARKDCVTFCGCSFIWPPLRDDCVDVVLSVDSS